jgi:hypothetical protein
MRLRWIRFTHGPVGSSRPVVIRHLVILVRHRTLVFVFHFLVFALWFMRQSKKLQRGISPAGTWQRAHAGRRSPAHAEERSRLRSVRGWSGVFYLGRHALKTYVCAREGSRSAVCVLARAENERYRLSILGVTDRCSGCAPRDCAWQSSCRSGWSARRHASARRDSTHRSLCTTRSERARSERCAEPRAEGSTRSAKPSQRLYVHPRPYASMHAV